MRLVEIFSTLAIILRHFFVPPHPGEQMLAQFLEASAQEPYHMGDCHVPDSVYDKMLPTDDPDLFIERVVEEQRSRRPDLFLPGPPPVSPRLPGDFEPARSLVLSYMSFPEYEQFYGDLIEVAVTAGEVLVLVRPDQRASFFRLLRRRRIPRTAVRLFDNVPYDTIWMRDYGPISVVTAEGPALVDGRYFVNCLQDDAVPSRLAQHVELPVFRADLWTEGGNLLSDGQGLCVTTTYLNVQNGHHEGRVRDQLRAYFGCERTVILEPLTGNVVPHVDLFLYFASPDTMLLGQYYPDQDPENYAILERNYARLRQIRTATGRPFEIVRVPMPDRIKAEDQPFESPLVRSYLNMLAFNGIVMVPVYDPPGQAEGEALDLIQQAFPGRRVEPIAADGVVGDGGTVHCMTQTVPAWP